MDPFQIHIQGQGYDKMKRPSFTLALMVGVTSPQISSTPLENVQNGYAHNNMIANT
jgi:hypothetical protein